MKLETHRRAAELFAGVCDLPADEQTTVLARLRVDEPEAAQLLDELLGRDRVPNARLDRPALNRSTPLATTVPTRIGAYRIVRRIGVGGMGVVYEAEQEHTLRRVALKLLRPGFATPELLARFEREARLLARLSHPGIAHVYDAGAADSDAGVQPYFAMELVCGEPLTDFAGHRRLSTRERFELLARVCDAVHHAHERGVIHRDLKPSNVFVDETGQPRVLDFGVARATDGDLRASSLHTEQGQLVGTLVYMSPEQVAADPTRVDARCDVYALGVIAYELIAGRVPFDVSALPIHAAARAIVERDPVPLGALDRRWRGDVETIVAKALAKERERRYASAAELAADLRRWLADEPIVARPASTSYQVAKFARRHRTLVAGVSAVLLALAAGVVASTRMYLRAEDARAQERDLREKAEETSATLRETNDYFLRILESPSPQVSGRDVRMIDVLDRAAQHIDGAFADRPKQRAYLLRALGRTYRGLGEPERAREYLEQALALGDVHLGDDQQSVAEIRCELGGALFHLGDTEGALAMVERALDDLARIGVDDPCVLAAAADSHGRMLLELGRVDEADAESQRALQLEAACGRQENNSIVQLRVHVLMARGSYDEAERLCREQLERELAGGAESDARTPFLMNTLAMLLHKQDRNREAVPWLERSLAITRKLAGEAHPDVANQMSNLATVLGGLGEYERALPLMRDALQRTRASVGGVHVDVAITLGNLGVLLDHAGQRVEALDTLRQADAMFVEVLGDSSVQRAFTLTYLGEALDRANELDAAKEALSQSLAMRRELLPADHPDLADVLDDLGRVEAKQGEHAAAAEHLGEAYRVWRELDGDVRSSNTLAIADQLASALAESGKTDEALAIARETLAYAEQNRANDALLLANERASLGWCLFLAGEFDPAERLLREALDPLTEHYGAEHPIAQRQRARLAELEAARAR